MPPTSWPSANNDSVAGSISASSGWCTSSHSFLGHWPKDISFDLDRPRLNSVLPIFLGSQPLSGEPRTTACVASMQRQVGHLMIYPMAQRVADEFSEERPNDACAPVRDFERPVTWLAP